MQTQNSIKSPDNHFRMDRQCKLHVLPTPNPYPHNDHLNSADLHQSQDHLLAKVG